MSLPDSCLRVAKRPMHPALEKSGHALSRDDAIIAEAESSCAGSSLRNYCAVPFSIVMAAPSGTWACPACTFENPGTALRCEMCDSKPGPEHRQMTVAEVAEPVHADDEAMGDDVPEATPVEEEPEYRRIIAEVTAQLDRGDGVMWEPSSNAVEAACENFDDSVCQTFIEQKLYKIVEIFVNIRCKGAHTWGDLRAIWRPNNKEVLYVRAFERCILNCTNICIKLMQRDVADPCGLKLVALVLDGSSKLYNDPPPRYTYGTSAIRTANSGHVQLYQDVCTRFKEGGCFERCAIL